MNNMLFQKFRQTFYLFRQTVALRKTAMSAVSRFFYECFIAEISYIKTGDCYA